MAHQRIGFLMYDKDGLKFPARGEGATAPTLIEPTKTSSLSKVHNNNS